MSLRPLAFGLLPVALGWVPCIPRFHIPRPVSSKKDVGDYNICCSRQDFFAGVASTSYLVIFPSVSRADEVRLFGLIKLIGTLTSQGSGAVATVHEIGFWAGIRRPHRWGGFYTSTWPSC